MDDDDVLFYLGLALALFFIVAVCVLIEL